MYYQEVGTSPEFEDDSPNEWELMFNNPASPYDLAVWMLKDEPEVANYLVNILQAETWEEAQDDLIDLHHALRTIYKYYSEQDDIDIESMPTYEDQ